MQSFNDHSTERFTHSLPLFFVFIFLFPFRLQVGNTTILASRMVPSDLLADPGYLYMEGVKIHEYYVRRPAALAPLRQPQPARRAPWPVS